MENVGDEKPTHVESHADDRSAGSDTRAVSRSAFKVGIGGLVSLSVGFVNQILIAALFGAGPEMDAYLTALTIPMYIQAVLLAGLSFVLIPAFVERVESERAGEAWALVGTFFWLVGGVTVVVTGALIALAGPIIQVAAPGLAPQKAAMAEQLMVILSFSTLFAGYGSLTVGVENARGRFFWPAAAGALNSIAQIATVLLFYRTLGIAALAWGFVAATAAQAAVTTVPVLRHGWNYRVPLRDPQFQQLMRLILPFIVFGIFTSLNPVIERYFASSLPDGYLSYLGYANRISLIFQSLLGATVVTAIFPQLSRSFALGGIKRMLTMFRYGVRLTLSIAFPVVLVASVLAQPIIAVLLQRGAFDAATTSAVAQVLPIYLIKGVLLLMVGNLLTRLYYVQGDTQTVPIVVVIATAIYLLLAGPMTQRWGYMGLAITDVISSLFGVVALTGLICLRLRILPWRPAARYTLLYLTPAVLAAGGAWLVLQLMDSTSLVALLASGTAAVGLYFGALFLLDREIAVDLLDVIGVSHLYPRRRQSLSNVEAL